MSAKKMKLTSASHSDFTLEALRQIAPSAFTEVRGEHGELTHKVDFEALKELLGDNISNSNAERFGFYWVGKQDAKRAAAEPTRKTLRPVLEGSVDWDNTKNLYIEGDNLEVLKLLQRAYLGKVKMIYIDPPYNTGKDFIYRDNFTMNQDEYARVASDVNTEGNRLHPNEKTHARYHSDWCSMLYSRLLVARSLLSQDGVIFISIDDNEVHHLRMICDEIFGASNIIAEVIVNRASDVATNIIVQKHEYCIVYAKQIELASLSGRKKVTVSRGTIGNVQQTTPIIEFPAGLKCLNIPDGIYTAARQIEGSKENIEVITPFVVKNGLLETAVQLKARWRSSNDMRNFFGNSCLPTLAKINGTIEEIYFDGVRLMPYIKKTITEKLPTLYTDNQRGSRDLERLNISGFDYPKAVNYIQFLVSLFTDQTSLILDFFSGSATTAHAVMQLNAEDGGKRKYICVQLPEKTPKDSEARKAGYSTISEIGKKRIRRAGDEIRKEHPEVDTGFRVLRVDTSNMKEVYFEPATLEKDQLFADSVKKDRHDLDLLFGCMLDLGIELSAPLRQKEVTGKRLHIVNEGALVACFDMGIDLEVIGSIASIQPQHVLFRESCFATDADKLNIYEQFKQRCGWSPEESSRRIHII